MLKLVGAAAVGALMALASPIPSIAQPGVPVVAAADTMNLSAGLRASKIIGAAVVNDANESVGKVDDVIITRDDRVVYAIVSVGGFLGVGSKLVAVKYDSLHPTVDNKGMVLPGATKESLKAQPGFTYTN